MSDKAVAILEPGYADYRIERAALEPVGVRVERIAEDEDAVAALSRIDPIAIFVRERSIRSVELSACLRLRLVVRYGVGVDNIDLDAARDRRIHVANLPEYGAETEVSEHAIALYLAVQRRVVARNDEVRQGGWSIGQRAPIPGRENAVLGLIGCGRIGLETARKFRALGFGRVLVHDPYVADEVLGEHGFERTDLDGLFAGADVVSLHAPLTDETRHCVNADRLARMKPGGIVINVARGGLIDEMALADALHGGRLYGAGLDVFEREPPDRDHPLFSAPNTVVSDHTAWYSERTVEHLQRQAASEVLRVLQGHAPASWVNPWGKETET